MRRLLLLSLLLTVAPLRAQQVPSARVDPYVLRLAAPDAAGRAGVRDHGWRGPAAVAVMASAVVPGAGQLLEGQKRWVPYLALEAWSWARFRERRGSSRELAAQYRDLAWRVARRVSSGARRDSIFEYYEAMTHFHASGAFDVSPGEPGVQPERDATTFNGDMWALSKQLHFPAGLDYPPGSPPYQAALSYYLAHAIPPGFAWAWGASNLEQQVFVDLITESDEAYRDGTRMLGLILANHIASTVDALITARLQAVSGGRGELRTDVRRGSEGARLQTELRLRF